MAGNFDFHQAEWPQLHGEAKKAERDALFDPRTTCFYARRTVEHVVKWLYRVESIPVPYKDDLAARLRHPPFKVVVPPHIVPKMNLIREWGNKAVHEARPVSKEVGHKALDSLFASLQSRAFRGEL